MADLGKALIVLGAVLVLLGLALIFAQRLPFRVGRLPGDILYRRGNFTFYFPLLTCILISVLLTLLFWLFGRQ